MLMCGRRSYARRSHRSPRMSAAFCSTVGGPIRMVSSFLPAHTSGILDLVEPDANTLRGYVPGAWDMFHVGHLNILKRARQHCGELIVGVVTDETLHDMKGKYPIVPLEERMEILGAIGIVDKVVADFSANKLDAWRRNNFDILFKGDDWRGTAKGRKLQEDMGKVSVKVHYFPYTASTSSTALRRALAAH